MVLLQRASCTAVAVASCYECHASVAGLSASLLPVTVGKASELSDKFSFYAEASLWHVVLAFRSVYLLYVIAAYLLLLPLLLLSRVVSRDSPNVL